MTRKSPGLLPVLLSFLVASFVLLAYAGGQQFGGVTFRDGAVELAEMTDPGPPAAGKVIVFVEATESLAIANNSGGTAYLKVTADGAFSLGTTPGAADGAITLDTLTVTTFLRSLLVEENTAESGDPNAITAAESGSWFSNQGATAENHHNLPPAAGGIILSFACVDVDGIQINAVGDDQIELGKATSVAAGQISAVDTSSTVTLMGLSSTRWRAVNIGGDWDVDDKPETNVYATLNMATPAATGAITPGTDILIAGTAQAGPNVRGFTVGTSGGRLTWNGARHKFKVSACISATSNTNNVIILWSFAKNGTVVTTTEQQRKLGTGTDVGFISVCAIMELDENDYFEVYVDAASGTPTVTVEKMMLNAFVVD